MPLSTLARTAAAASRRSLRVLRTPRGLLVAGLAAATVVTGAASAQFGQSAGFGDVMRPYYIRRDLQVFADELDLDETQRSIVETFFWDYEDEEASRKEQMLQSIANLRDDLQDIGREEAIALIFEPFENKARDWEQSREMLLNNVQAILSERQLEQWPEFRRTLRRVKELPRSRFAGEGLDLNLVIERMDLGAPARAIIDDAMGQWELELDRALVVREQQESEARIPMMRAIRDDDHSDALRLYDREIDARVRVREVNDRALEEISALLPAELGARFRREALRTGYPSIFRRITGERLYDAALELDLDAETRAAVASLRSQFLTELDALNMDIVEATRAYEPRKARFSAESFARRSNGGQAGAPPADPTQDAFGDRKQLELRYVQALRDVIGDDRFRGLPGASRFMQRPGTGAMGASDPYEGKPEQRKREAERREGERRGIGSSGGG